MPELSEKTHWDSIHKNEGQYLLQPSTRSNFKQALKRMLGSSVMSRISNYSDYVLWELIFPKHFQSIKGAKVVEIGSAPGKFLVEFSQKYGCIPYGIEY